MNKCIAFVGAALLLVTLSGCGASRAISLKAQGGRSDVFEDVTTTAAVPAGYADVIIQASIKTHLEGYYICETKKSAHGKATYPFLVNIDGQVALWNVEGVKHELPAYGDGGKTSRDPEAGAGMKYSFAKKVRLSEGTHTVFFGLPEESYYTVKELTVKSGGSYVLAFRPEYRYKRLPTRIPSFLQGISHYVVSLSESGR